MVKHRASFEMGTNLDMMRQAASVLLMTIALALSVHGFKEEEFKVICATEAHKRTAITIVQASARSTHD